MMQQDATKALKILHLKNVWLPILCGLAITLFLFGKSGKISLSTFSYLSNPNWGGLSIALIAILCREFGHMYRLRLISDGALSWSGCFYVVTLWEFSSSVTPSVVGGGIVAMLLLSKEGFSLGRSLAYVIVIGIMDNLFFLLAGLPSFWGAYEPYFSLEGGISYSIQTVFFTNYALLLGYTSIMAMGVFVNPKLLQWILMRVTNFWVLKRWRASADQLSQDIIFTAQEFTGRSFYFWARLLLCTVLTWAVRYTCLNWLIEAYHMVSWSDHLAILGKQVVMWALMLVPVSPGGSGIAEFLFQHFFEPILGEATLGMSLLWRMATFYLYLILGAIFLPKWVRRVFYKQKRG